MKFPWSESTSSILYVVDCNKSLIPPFRGISLIRFEDLFQLRPVGDAWIFENDSVQYDPLLRNLWLDLVQLYEMTTIMRQNDDAIFASCLNRIREGKQTKEDIDLIASRLCYKEDTQCIHLVTPTT